MLHAFLLTALMTMAAGAQSPAEMKYDAKADPQADFQVALSRASKNGKNILMDVGGEWCSWCHRMDKFLVDNAELSELLASHYVLVKVNFSEENKNEQFLKNYPDIDGYPHIFVFSPSGKRLISKSTGDLEEGKSYDLGRFKEFLTRYAPKL